LELCTVNYAETLQFSGQVDRAHPRIEGVLMKKCSIKDKVKWAKEILSLYEEKYDYCW
jgi:hypothetical protein